MLQKVVSHGFRGCAGAVSFGVVGFLKGFGALRGFGSWRVVVDGVSQFCTLACSMCVLGIL